MKLKIQSTMMACMALFCASLTSCTDEVLIETSDNSGKPFALTVTQAAPESRLELGEDGLTTLWEPGDKLVLIDKNRTLAPIYLSCTLEEKADQATFISESGVPAGDYYVIYNYNENLAYGHKGFQSVETINSNDDLVLWTELTITEGKDSETITLAHLYTKIRVVLVNPPTGMDGMGFNGIIGMYSSKNGFPMYKQFTSSGLVDAEYGYYFDSMNYSSTNTYFPSSRRYHNIRFGQYNSTYVWDESTQTSSYDYSAAQELSALVLPANLSGEDVFFYVLDANGYTCYEIKKPGIEFKAGKSYKVELDLSQATVSTLAYNYDETIWLNNYQLTNAADWRHAAYRNVSEAYELTQNIDFANDYFFPIPASRIKGNNYTLSNINLDWNHENNVGLARFEWSGELNMPSNPHQCSTSVQDLTLENVTFKGNNNVGAFGGWNISASNCKVIGSSVISGQGNYVGGIVGRSVMSSDRKLSDVRVGQSCTVSGKNYVGGIVGQYIADNDYGEIYGSPSMMLLESCKSEAAVTGTEDYVGGIFGKIGGGYGSSSSTSINFSLTDYTFSLVKCVNEGTVSGRHYVGGVGGDFAVTLNGTSTTTDPIVLSQSCSTGTVSGDTKVGGVLGSTTATTNTCYSTGSVNATTSMVGGIVGEFVSGSQVRIANCYSLATITVGTDDGIIGGIVGTTGMATITNCYYAADPTNTFGGIVGNSGGYTTVSNCLTTLPSLGKNLGSHQYSTGADQDGDGVADYDYNGDQVIDSNDLYIYANDDTTGSQASITSILANVTVINGENAYSTSNTWTGYQWECVKFSSFSAETVCPDYTEDSYPNQ